MSNKPYATIEYSIKPNSEKNDTDKWINKSIGTAWHKKDESGERLENSPYKMLFLEKSTVTRDEQDRKHYEKSKAVSITFEDGEVLDVTELYLTLKVGSLFNKKSAEDAKASGGAAFDKDDFSDDIPF